MGETKRVNENYSAEIEQQYIEEGKRILREEPDKWPGFLNNFWGAVIPEDNKHFLTSREKERKLGHWDKRLKDATDAEKAKSEGQYSELRLNQTATEFYGTIDNVIKELDVDGSIGQAINNLCNVKNANEREVAQNELEEKLIPVFARLVAMGYIPAELRM